MGLLGAGYELFDRSNPVLCCIAQALKRKFIDKNQLREYFGKARTNENAINPYWPRGSGIVGAAFFTDPALEVLDLSAYLSHESATASHSAWKNREYLDWIGQLPTHLRLLNEIDLVEQHRLLDSEYQSVKGNYEDLIRVSEELLSGFLDVPIEVDNLNFIPNFLQAPELTDVIREGKTVHVIATKPRTESLIHELIHCVIHDELTRIPPSKLKAPLTDLDLDSMAAYGYYCKYKDETTLRVIEESLVRLVVAVLSTPDDLDSAMLGLREEGFWCPEAFVNQFADQPKLSKLKELIGKLAADLRK